MESEGAAAIMAHGYTIVMDDPGTLLYRKTHENGEKTEVQIDRVGTEATGGHSYLLNVDDPNKSFRVGRFETKEAARSRATSWMNNHPKGVTGPGGAMGAMDAMDQGATNIFEGGDFF